MVPGNAERLLWGSARADQTGSYALAGAKDAVLDAAISAMVNAKDWTALRAASRLFDRALRWHRFAIPLWRNDEVWLAYWDDFGQPQNIPGYAPSFVDRWWSRDLSLN